LATHFFERVKKCGVAPQSSVQTWVRQRSSLSW